MVLNQGCCQIRKILEEHPDSKKVESHWSGTRMPLGTAIIINNNNKNKNNFEVQHFTFYWETLR